MFVLLQTGSVGTKRQYKQPTSPSRVTIKKDEEGDNDYNDDDNNDEDDNDDDDENDENNTANKSNFTGLKHSGLVVVPVTKQKMKTVKKLNRDEESDIDTGDDTNYNGENEKNIFHQVEHINKVAKERNKLYSLKLKLAKLRQKKQQHFVPANKIINSDSKKHVLKQSNDLVSILSKAALTTVHRKHANTDDVVRNNFLSLDTSETRKHLPKINLKQKGLSMVNDPHQYDDATHNIQPQKAAANSHGTLTVVIIFIYIFL